MGGHKFQNFLISANLLAGGQCAFQAHTNLVWSIPSIGKSTPFGDVTVIRPKMVTAVKVIKDQMRTGIIPTDQVERTHYYPGDERLVEVSKKEDP